MEQQSNTIQEEYDRFIQFGQVLDKPTRRYFVAYLQQLLTGNEPPEAESLKSDYFHYFEDALQDLFEDPDLQALAQKHHQMAQQIVADTLTWFRKTYREIATKHPYEDEQRELESWGVRHLRQFVKSYPFLGQKVSSFYTREEIDPGFHLQQFKEIIRDKNYEKLTQTQRDSIERVFHDLLAQWDARLQAKILQYQMQHLQQQKDDYKSKLKAKVQEYQKLSQWIKPFTEHLSRYWDMSRALWEDTTLNLVEKYNHLLEDEEELKRLAEHLGRLRKAAIETEEEHYEKTVVYKEWVKDPNQKAEITGVRSHNDLNNVLSSEIALFDGSTEWQFLKRFADAQLQVNRYEDEKLVHSSKVYGESRAKVKEKKKGPFIVCVDTSGSMEGEPERIAKVLCFGVLKMAAAQDRPAFLINFSSGIHTIDLHQLSDNIDEVARFLGKSFHGGTDISLALTEALQQLETHRYQDADVLVISDFIMYKISDDLLQRMEKQQHNHNTQFYSLIITDEANEDVIQQFDKVWSYHPDDKRIMAHMHRNLKAINERKI